MIKVILGNNVSRKTVIVSRDISLRKCLEENNVDFSKGVTNLDGSTVVAGGLNKTFAELGYESGAQCYLLNVVKADNAAKVTVVGDAVIITSSLTKEDIETVKKYRSKALVLKGGEDNKEDVFAISTTNAAGSISSLGANFSGVSRDGDGFATITMSTIGLEDVKEYIADTYGEALINLAKLEEQLPAVIEEIKAQKEAVIEGIEVM